MNKTEQKNLAWLQAINQNEKIKKEKMLSVEKINVTSLFVVWSSGDVQDGWAPAP